MHTVQYKSARTEVWGWYWRSWAALNGLWRFHVAISLLAAATVTVVTKEPFELKHFLAIACVAFVVCVTFLPLWPQLCFKPTLRTLTIDDAGLSTSIGKRSGSRSWKDINSIVNSQGAIVITSKNRNAFIVPSRAFENDLARRNFYELARQYHSRAIA